MDSLYQRAEIYDLAHTPKMEEAMRTQWHKLLGDKQVQTVLDCSIGSGNLSLSLAELGYTLTGSDLSGEMLSRCAQKAEARNLSVTLQQCDFRSLSEKFATKFDCVMSTGHSLPYVTNTDVRKALCEMDKLVADGGYLYLDIRNWDKILRTKQRFYFYPPFFQEDVRINLMQVWDYPPDETVTFNLLYAFEKDNKIVQREIFEEHYYPLKKQFVLDTLQDMGYQVETTAIFPYVKEVNLDETDWWCLLAKKQT